MKSLQHNRSVLADPLSTLKIGNEILHVQAFFDDDRVLTHLVYMEVPSYRNEQGCMVRKSQLVAHFAAQNKGGTELGLLKEAFKKLYI